MRVGAGSTLAKELLEMVVVGAKVDGGVHDVHETASRGTAGTGTAGHRAGDGEERDSDKTGGQRRPRRTRRESRAERTELRLRLERGGYDYCGLAWASVH